MIALKVLDAEKAKLDVKYCIPDWLRDEQVKLSCDKYKDRIQKFSELKKEPIALVCFGPSLRDTWPRLHEFQTIMTCSGAYKFLRDLSFDVNYHVEVDPRSHKIQLIGNNISPTTEFLMASCCHPDVFAHLDKFHAKIKLWHTYSGESKDKVPTVYPRGEWLLTGGANVGLRAMVIARFLGYTDIHVFGMDGSFPLNGTHNKHAAFHPNSPQKHILAEFGGKQYATTEAYLSCARMTFHELEMLPDVNVTFYGEGLVQDMAKTKKIERRTKAGIAFYTPEVISHNYVEQNKKLHASLPHYGISVLRHIETIKKMYDKTKARSLLDYGCGKGMLAKHLDFPIWEYDPAISGKDNAPRSADLVVCIDVLEHIEPEYLDGVLTDLKRVTKKVGFFTIATREANKKLEDGRNTHLIVENKDWWKEKLLKYFDIPEGGIIDKGDEVYFVVSPKTKGKPIHFKISENNPNEAVRIAPNIRDQQLTITKRDSVEEPVCT